MQKILSIKFIILGCFILSSLGTHVSAQNVIEPLIDLAIKKTPSLLNSEFKNIRILEKDYKNPDLAFEDYFCQPGNKVKYGSFKSSKKSTIYLDKNLLAFYLQKKNAVIDCLNITVEEFTTRTLVHELIHHYDKKHGLSRQKTFLDIIGGKKNKVLSQNTASTPDSYEFKNTKESLAVNSEYFFFDNEYKCRRPSLYRFFKEQFKFNPSVTDCTKYNYFLLHDSKSEDNLTQLEILDHKRVHSIHYLWAGEGNAMMSKWGHAMLRIVVCAPFRKTVNDDCIKDTRYHLVLSYRAHFSSPNASMLNGMVGKLPSQLFIFRLQGIIEEYTINEFRDIYSVPLDLSRDEIESIIDLSLDRYWNYKSKYYFLSNNCGTETLRHLAAVLDGKSLENISDFTPRKIFKGLTRKGNNLVSVEFNKEDKESLIDEGLLFPSKFDLYNKAIKSIAKGSEFESKIKNPSDFAKIETIFRKEAYLRHYRSINEENLRTKVAVINRILLTEIYVHRINYASLSSEILQINKMKTKDFSEMSKPMFQSQWDIIDTTYGIPSLDDIKSSLNKRKKELEKAIGQIENDFKELQGAKTLPQKLQRRLSELEESKTIIEEFRVIGKTLSK